MGSEPITLGLTAWGEGGIWTHNLANNEIEGGVGGSQPIPLWLAVGHPLPSLSWERERENVAFMDPNPEPSVYGVEHPYPMHYHSPSVLIVGRLRHCSESREKKNWFYPVLIFFFLFRWCAEGVSQKPLPPSHGLNKQSPATFILLCLVRRAWITLPILV